MTTTKAKLEFIHAMARHSNATVRQCEALMRYAATLQRLAEDDCNIAMDAGQRDKFERKRQRMESRVMELCADITGPDVAGVVTQHLCPVFSGDPRGAVLKIRVPGGWSDGFGGEGICVPS